MPTTTKTVAHTPGPWILNADGHVYAEPFIKQSTVLDKDGVQQPHVEGLVALVYSGSVPIDQYAETQAANERLIAAAPDLLDSLKVAAPEYCSLRCPSSFTSPDQPRHTPECDAIRAAIAKAEGGAK